MRGTVVENNLPFPFSISADVLLVDDREENLIAFEASLRGVADKIFKARSGYEAVRLAERHGNFAAILLDVMMPGMDGFDTAKLIRQKDRLSGIPLIFVTANSATESQTARGYAAGAVDFVYKPVATDVLQSKVKCFVELFRKTSQVRELERRTFEMEMLQLRRSMESEQLRKSEERFRRIAELIPHVVWTATPSGDFDYLNGRWTEFTGQNPDYAKGAGWQVQLHSDDIPRALSHWTNALQTGRELYVECRVRAKEGVFRWFLLKAFAERDTSGKVVRWLGTCTDIHEAKQRRFELEQLKLLTDKARDSLSLADRNGKFIYASKTAYESLDYTSEEFFSRTIADIDCGHSLADFQILFDRSQKESIPPFASIAQRKDGTRFPTELSITGVRIEGQPFLFAVSRDISDRKRAEESLIKSEQMLKLAVEAVGVGTWELDFRTMHRTVSDMAKRLYGLEIHEELTYEYWLSVVHVDDRDYVKQIIDRSMSQRLPYNFEHRVVEPDGNVRWFSTQGRIVNDEDGAPARLIGICVDISEHKRVQEQIRLREAKFRQLAEALPTIVFSCDPEGVELEYINTKWFDYIGVKAEHYDNRKWREYMHPDDVAGIDDAWDKVVQVQPDFFELEYRVRRNDGMFRWHLARIVAVRENGRLVRWMGSVTDVHDAFEGRVQAEERAQDLARSNHELAQFAYVASHDLKEPLRMVTNYVQLLERHLDGRLDEQGKTYVRFAVDGATRMYQLVNDLLGFSRAGRRPEPFAIVDMTEILKGVVQDLKPCLETAGGEVSFSELPNVRGDAGQLHQVLQNLVSNALKFRRKGIPPRIEVSARKHEHEWEISVSDNGIGIEPHYKDRVFFIFQRLHSNADYPGTGIGLAICKKIVERHGGRIWFEPNASGGAIFRLTIPALSE